MPKHNARAGLIITAAGIIGLVGCTGVYPEEAPRGQYLNSGYYSYEDYPDTYQYYDAYGRPHRAGPDYRPGYSNDPNLRYDARGRGAWHSDDHNYHNRDDFDHWDY